MTQVPSELHDREFSVDIPVIFEPQKGLKRGRVTQRGDAKTPV